MKPARLFLNNFSFLRHTVVMVVNGHHCVLREKECYEDMTRLVHL